MEEQEAPLGLRLEQLGFWRLDEVDEMAVRAGLTFREHLLGVGGARLGDL